jgi:CheY-like chemotaxis protein
MNPSPPGTKTTHSISRSDLKVLVVDDDPFQLDVISAILRSLGITNITLATSGAQALQTMAIQQGFDLLVTDLHMPDMDGFLFMAHVAMDGYCGALIIVSGQNGDVMQAASLVAKLRRFTLLGLVRKPVNRTAFADLISKLA